MADKIILTLIVLFIVLFFYYLVKDITPVFIKDMNFLIELVKKLRGKKTNRYDVDEGDILF